MTADPSFEVSLLKERLHTDFDNRVPRITFRNQSDVERNFCSRALAAFAIHKLSGCGLDEAADSVVDGSHDGGIDAIYYAPTSNTLWIVQSKFIENGRGEPALSDVIKFQFGLKKLLDGQFTFFENNLTWQSRLPTIARYFDEPSLQVRAILVYSGINLVSEDRLRLFNDFRNDISPTDNYFKFNSYNLTSLDEWLIDENERGGVREIQLEIRNPGVMREPYETIFGLVRLDDIAKLERIHGAKLIASNLRCFVGDTEVNRSIIQTLQTEPKHFMYLNNGLTAYCERFTIHNLDRSNQERKRVTARDFSIVNGAQTLGAIRTAWQSHQGQAFEGFVFLRVFSLERCVENEQFARRLTQTTNFQNQVGLRDFVALDPEQKRIASRLHIAGIEYHYKADDDTPDPDETNFTLEEATTALACLERQNDCDLCTRVLANRKSLWSFENEYPDDNPQESRYKKLFHSSRSPLTVWRAVQVQRIVLKQMKDSGKASTGVRKTFFENARWLVLNLIFLKVHPHEGQGLSLSEDQHQVIVAKTIEFAEILWRVAESKGFISRSSDLREPLRHLRSVFCSQADCQILRNGVLSEVR